MRIVLTGPRKGQTVQLNKRQFVRGVYDTNTFGKKVMDQRQAMMELEYFKRCYGCRMENDPEIAEVEAKYQVALAEKKAEEAKRGVTHGKPHIPAPSPVGPDAEVRRDVQPSGRGAPEGKPDGDRSGHDQGQPGNPGVHPSGDRHPDTRVPADKPGEQQNPDPVAEKIKSAVMTLDPSDDNHWTTKGKPAVAVVAERSGVADLDRTKLDGVAGDFTREVAAGAGGQS